MCATYVKGRCLSVSGKKKWDACHFNSWPFDIRVQTWFDNYVFICMYSTYSTWRKKSWCSRTNCWKVGSKTVCTITCWGDEKVGTLPGILFSSGWSCFCQVYFFWEEDWEEKKKRKKEAIRHQWKENETSFWFCSLSSDQIRGGERSYLYIHICIP